MRSTSCPIKCRIVSARRVTSDGRRHEGLSRRAATRLNDERLVDELKKAKEELFNLRFQSRHRSAREHGRLRAVRREIARIYTVMRERELGAREPERAEVTRMTEAPRPTTRRACATAARSARASS